MNKSPTYYYFPNTNIISIDYVLVALYLAFAFQKIGTTLSDDAIDTEPTSHTSSRKRALSDDDEGGSAAKIPPPAIVT